MPGINYPYYTIILVFMTNLSSLRKDRSQSDAVIVNTLYFVKVRAWAQIGDIGPKWACYYIILDRDEETTSMYMKLICPQAPAF